MAGGSIKKEKPTDQQCSKCSLWYDSRGIDRHEKECDGSRPDDPADEVDVFDPDAEREPEEISTETNNDTMTATCPECESPDDVMKPITFAKLLDRRDQLTEQMKKQLEDHDHVCAGCEVVWDD